MESDAHQSLNVLYVYHLYDNVCPIQDQARGPGGTFYRVYRGILVYIICLISISNSISDRATNILLLNIESS